MESLDLLLPALLDSLNAPSERVVVESLTVQASIAEDEDRFRHLMDLLLDRCIDTTLHGAFDIQEHCFMPAVQKLQLRGVDYGVIAVNLAQSASSA